MNTKNCRKCGCTKPLSEFYKRLDALSSVCKACAAAYSKQRYAKKKAELNARSREYYRAHRDERCRKSREWKLQNPEKYQANLDKWRRNNKDRCYEHARSWTAKNKKRMAAYRGRWAKQHPAKCADYQRKYVSSHRKAVTARIVAWQKRNPEKTRPIKQARRAREYQAFVEAVNPALIYERDLGLCQICGLPVEAGEFHLDHVIAMSRGGKHSYANCQTAHSHCNVRKYSKSMAECRHLWMRG